MRKGTRAFFAASAVAQAAALVRYIILARLLGPEELGLAAMLILTAQFFEMISDAGSDRFIVQDAEGGTPKVLGLVHLVMVGRGVLIALSLAATSGLIAGIYRSPEIQSSLVFLALAPLVAGFSHFGIRAAQRDHDFRPESTVTIAAELASSIVTAIAAFILRDHTAIIYGLVARAVVQVVVSHIVGGSPYGWAFSSIDAKRFSAFAMPLFLNGLLLYFGSQGDRLIVGRSLGPEALGHYSAILLLAYYPASMITRFIGGIHMPLLATARDTPARYEREEAKLAARTTLLSLGIVAGFAVVGPICTPLFYGSEFQQPLQVFTLMAILQAGRLLRAWPTTAAVSLGRSTIVLLNNIARIMALPVALLAYHVFGSLESIIIGFIFGEITALLVALLLLGRNSPISLRDDLARVGLCAAGCATILALSWAIQLRWFIAVPPLVLANIAVAAVVWRFESKVIGDTLRLVQEKVANLRRR